MGDRLVPWGELLAHLASMGDELESYTEPRAAYAQPGAEIYTRDGHRYVSSWEGIELRGNAWLRKVRWNRV